MTVSEALEHILHLTLRWWHQEKTSEMRKNALVSSDDSITTPLGYQPYKRNPTTNVSLQDGIEKARKRSYATRECRRLGE